ncbi:hypothetical protein SDJN03_00188, partial [Cucurbita argyrosperma subsp. sororia]
MGAYACLLISLLLFFQLPNASPLPSNSNHSINSLPLVIPPGGGDTGGEQNLTVAGWVVLRARGGGRSVGAGGSIINRRPRRATNKNAASNLFVSKLSLLLISSCFYLF